MHLVLKDLSNDDKYYRDLIETMKIISSKIHTLTQNLNEELKIGSFPPLQSQRWNSTLLVLTYIMKHIDGILKLFSGDKISNLQLFELL